MTDPTLPKKIQFKLYHYRKKQFEEDNQEAREFARVAWKLALCPRERLSPSAWVGRYFKFGANRESFDLERFPWLIEPTDCVADYRVEEQLLICPPQVGKSLDAEAVICFFIVEDPGDLVAYTHTIPMAKMWSEQRVMPNIKRCDPIQPFLPLEPKRYRTLEILMNHMVIEVAPANETQTQSRSRRIVICDERWLWEAGRYDNAKRRADSPNYEGRKKIISYSNSGKWEADVELQWRSSDQRVAFSKCPSCGEAHPYKFSPSKCRRVPEKIPGFSIKFTENATTRPNGVWDIREVVKTVRLVCPSCKTEFEDTPKIRHALRKSMHYVALNPLGSPKSRAWSISGVAVYPWADLVKQFINALQQLDLGDAAAMEEFVLKGLNEPWSEDVILDTVTNPASDYAMTGLPWVEADFAAMSIDVQELAPYFWYVIRDWKQSGPSRLRRCGPAHTWDELRDIQEKEKIFPSFVHVDVSYKPDEVYQRCAEWGWLALRGRPEDYFIHSVSPAGAKPYKVRRYFSEKRLVDPAIGTDNAESGVRRRAIEFMWADTPVKDVLVRLYSGRGIYFGVPKDVPPYYLQQMGSERKQIVETRGSREIRRWVKIGKRPNHLWDCEAMQIVFALIKGPLRLASEVPTGSSEGEEKPAS